MSNIIELRGITKDYQLGEYHGGGLFQSLGRLLRGRLSDGRVTHRALDGIDIDVEAGEVLGIIGRNGSGKSTLLKILARITEPTAGTGVIRGRVAPLLEVGTGFNPELTGRENVLVNGALLGMTKAEVDAEFDNIVAFAGVEKFIDTPVKRYSSGMKVRLGFAVAAHLQPEILLVDEVLAVGDAAFQRQCLKKIGGIAATGRTVLFVSHQLEMITNLCTRVIWLESGKVRQAGAPEETVRAYLQSGVEAALGGELADERDGSGAIRFKDIEIRSRNCDLPNTCFPGDDLELIMPWRAGAAEVKMVEVFVWLDSPSVSRICCLSNRLSGESLTIEGKAGQLLCNVEAVNVVPGDYYATVMVKVNGELADRVVNGFKLTVLPGDFFGSGKSAEGLSKILLRHSWSSTIDDTAE